MIFLFFFEKKIYHYLLRGGSKFILNSVFFDCLPETFVPSDTFCKSLAACCIITWDWLSPQIADLNTVPSWPIFFFVDSFFYFFHFFFFFLLKHIEAMGNILSCFSRISSLLGDKLKMDWHLGRNIYFMALYSALHNL